MQKCRHTSYCISFIKYKFKSTVQSKEVSKFHSIRYATGVKVLKYQPRTHVSKTKANPFRRLTSFYGVTSLQCVRQLRCFALFTCTVKKLVCRAYFCFFKQNFKHKNFSSCNKKLPAYINATKKRSAYKIFYATLNKV